MAPLDGLSVYKNSVRELVTTDAAHPDTWNPINQDLINNDVFLKARSDETGMLGYGFIPYAGTTEVAYDGQDRISTVTYKNDISETTATVTVTYDDGNGGRVNYVEAVVEEPVDMTIRNTYLYDGNNQITGTTRTIS